MTAVRNMKRPYTSSLKNRRHRFEWFQLDDELRTVCRDHRPDFSATLTTTAFLAAAARGGFGSAT
jgi:hypothetical protein